jgi:exopolyphosphatase/guanosine-5'-triphosphate,3'-diphosphate pyrophosphatase
LNQRVAVIDLGTNTFHLLIVDLKKDGTFDTVFKQRKYVYLGGADINHIDDEAFVRGISTLKEFRELMDQYEVVNYKAIGTAALRSAKNNQQFIDTSAQQANINITLISGDQEAQYIARGIGKLYQHHRPHLVMDIGGGSVEFIKGGSTIEWFQSFKVGISILYHQFMRVDPIDSSDLEALNEFLDEKLKPLLAELDSSNSYDLIGAAGTYEILATYLHGEFSGGLATLDINGIRDLYDKSKTMSIEQRMKIDGIPTHRAKYLVVSLALIIYILNNVNIKEVYVSAYSMKEGILAEFLDASKN